MKEELSIEQRNMLLAKYIELKKNEEKTFTKNDKEYALDGTGFLQYIKDEYGLVRTNSWLCRALKEYNAQLEDRKEEVVEIISE